MRNALQPVVRLKPLRQLSIVLDSLELKGISITERRLVINRLARLMMEAAGVEIEESGDDGR
jgi:hypothetical protein